MDDILLIRSTDFECSIQHPNNKITNLDLSYNNIGPEGTKYLASALQVWGFVIVVRLQIEMTAALASILVAC